MLPRVNLLGTSERYANIITPITRDQIKPGMVYIQKIDDFWCVFKQTNAGKIRRGGYKTIPDAVFGALWK